MANLVSAFDRDRPELMGILREFRATRVKDVGIRRLALWGIALARVYDMADDTQAPEIYARMKDMTDKLLSVYEHKQSYVENRMMRGWPMIVDTRDTHETFEVRDSKAMHFLFIFVLARTRRPVLTFVSR